MKKFKGYLILGVTSYEDAKLRKGLIIWCQKKPSKTNLFFLRKLLSIYWVDFPKEHKKSDKFEKMENVQITK